MCNGYCLQYLTQHGYFTQTLASQKPCINPVMEYCSKPPQSCILVITDMFYVVITEVQPYTPAFLIRLQIFSYLCAKRTQS